MVTWNSRRLLVVALLALASGVWLPAFAEPLTSPVAAPHQTTDEKSYAASPVAHRLCGRGMSGRCSKWKAACLHGTAADCARWTAWSKACDRCATAFARCRDNPANSCGSCIVAHDACEAKFH